ncbi:hypothetical protein Mapa_004206 [Marchantia paleacea]|nr:hypothetical protein Mapa_004206 [Marchantia paleacea]
MCLQFQSFSDFNPHPKREDLITNLEVVSKTKVGSHSLQLELLRSYRSFRSGIQGHHSV